MKKEKKRALSALEESGELKNMQPSEQDVETAIMAIVGRRDG